MTAFEELGVMPEIAQAVEEMEWNLPTDIQAEGIPMILGGGDVLMAAETGSGKTGAFCLPLIQIIAETLADMKAGKGGKSTQSKPANKWKMNMFDRGEKMAIDTEEGLLCQSRDAAGWHGVRSNKGVSNRGKCYYEATVTDEGLCRIGWSTKSAKLDLGTDQEGFGFGGTGKKSFGRQFDTYGEPYGMDDTIGCHLDLDNQTIKWTKNGVDLGKAYDIPGQMKDSVFYAATCLKNAELKFNFGDSEFKYPPQGGFTAFCQAAPDTVTSSGASGGPASNKPAAPNAPYAIIIEPSRELADQTYTQVQKFKKHLTENPIRELLVIGGGAAREQVDALKRGVDIIVGTPGRLEDLISTGNISLESVRFFVLDECDGLLSSGYTELINRIYQQIPKVTSDGKRLQMIVASATLHNFDVKKLAEKIMHFPTWIDLKGQDSVPETVHHVVLMVDPRKDQSWKTLNKHVQTDGVHDKDQLNPGIDTPEMMSEAVKMLKGDYCIRAIREHKMDKAIIFCRTKLDCDNMEKYMIQVGGGHGRNTELSCVCLHSDRKPQERKGNLEKFKNGEVKFMICTDVAARGIDVAGLPFVINVTLPDEKQNYVHRIGRVGRADRMGLAVSFSASVKEKVWYHSNCNNRGKGCYNTDLTERRGCCIWYDEPKYIGEIEEHLGVTIDQVEIDLKVPVDSFDGKVTYGAKKKNTGSGYKGHIDVLAPAAQELSAMETKAQGYFLTMKYEKPFLQR